ncbi:MAG: hypothetical protein AAGI07_09440, partial [Bacteroidota bacterium]
MNYFLRIVFTSFLLLKVSSLFSQHNSYQRALLHLANRKHLEAKYALDSALKYERYKVSAEAWFRKGELALKLAELNENDFESYLQYNEEAITSFERVKYFEMENTPFYTSSNNYIDKIWEGYIKKALAFYDKGAFSNVITCCNKAKNIYPEDLNAYLYAGLAAEKLNNTAAVLENYYRLIDSGYYRDFIFFKVMALEKQKGNYKQVVRLTQLAETIFPEKKYDFFIETVMHLHKLKQFYEAEKLLLASPFYNSNNIQVLLLLVKNSLYSDKLASAKKYLKKISAKNDFERL